MFYKQMKNVLFIYFWFKCLQAFGYSGKTTQDLAPTRANTLSDDADDLQKQLDNEARDRLKFGRPQTIWILHYPTKTREIHEMDTTETLKLPLDNKSLHKENLKLHGTKCVRKICACHFASSTPKPKRSWNYTDQDSWHLSYTSCSGIRQSPVDLPVIGLMVITKASRRLLFAYYDVRPNSMTLVRNGETVSLIGDWESERPFVYGGAAHSRRYVFHSLAIRRPSEHTIGGLYYPMESQAVHVSVEYPNIEAALHAAPRDKSALLVIANIYKYSNRNHEGLEELVDSVISQNSSNMFLDPLPLQVFSPPLREYAAYHGSLTTPPCTEAVFWLVRARALPISRELAEVLERKSFTEPGRSFRRLVQPLNDRKIYYFN